jgi:hypothetical protein
MHRKCPFAAPITTGRAACTRAQEVVRRGGSEYDCAAPAAQARCTDLHQRLKAVGLTAFEVEDDLTTMPHSVLVKVQVGGLAGLQRLLGQPAGPIADVDTLVEQAAAQAGGIDAIPVATLADDMTGCKLERRGRRRG